MDLDIEKKVRWEEMKKPLLDHDHAPPIGQNRFKWDNGLYHGDAFDQMPFGRGKWYNQDGELCYAGDWVRGKRHGEGREYRDGRLVYSGEWKLDQRYGYGTLWNYETETILQGEFGSNGNFKGKKWKMNYQKGADGLHY